MHVTHQGSQGPEEESKDETKRKVNMISSVVIHDSWVSGKTWNCTSEQFPIRSITKWIFEHVPFVMRWHRNLIMARFKADFEFLIFRESNKRLRDMAQKGLTSYIKAKAPEALWDKLTPRYPVGAKQIIVDPDYLSSFHRPNVLLEDTPIAALVENGVKLQNGEVVPVDAVVFATGYSLEPETLVIRGHKGKTIKEYFNEHGGLTAYLGCNFPGFPNLCYIIGPNAATGHASLLFDMEAQIQLAIQLAKPVLQNQVQSIEIKESVTDEYNKWLQDRIATSVWPAASDIYYYVDRTKNIAMFSGPATLFWWLARKPKWEEWEIKGGRAEEWKVQMQRWK
ncbi:hypothetical protein K435DRAFT_793227 [Dendrothele bispora CBS 962.96]|uniref:FAD/NAD(P)-binding domain-containing protein n=1 Tax=Dendrothele bispora (strain CBS 962.96) TaxID=1314807 RepID=A0A4S8MG31_DENBC|nr:hypothetical protein K435DRAFT_793227 [Dendrothele bispora CBS 962.96]